VINSGSVWSAPAGYRFPREVIAVAVRWYLRYGLSYRDVAGQRGTRLRCRIAWFTLDPGDLAGDRWEAKVVAATVSLKGVTAATPSFALVLTHGPRCTDRLKDGTDLTAYLRPRDTLLQIAPIGGQATGTGAILSNERPTDFWRRSVATDWLLMLEPAVVEERSVDLSNLTEIT
jgi:hypothetical protein